MSLPVSVNLSTGLNGFSTPKSVSPALDDNNELLTKLPYSVMPVDRLAA